jgi:hypothetical protein
MAMSNLFNVFPREIGIPWESNFYRKTITSIRDLKRYISIVNGNRGCYVSLYDINDKIVLDKIVFDLDSNNLSTSLNDTKKLVRRIVKAKLPYTVLFSGRKGFHVYILLKPQKVRRDVAGFFIKEIQNNFKYGIESVDNHLVGNVSAMIRIPNTLNRNRYCTFLPVSFMGWDIDKILEWSKEQHDAVNSFTGEYRTIEDITGNLEIRKHPEGSQFGDDITLGSVPSIEMLNELIRPCVLNEMLHPVRGVERGPKHIIRIDLVSELMFLAFSKHQVLEVFRNFEMGDFSEEKTMYQINKIFDGKIKPYGCKKLRNEVKCTECGWKYWW